MWGQVRVSFFLIASYASVASQGPQDAFSSLNPLSLRNKKESNSLWIRTSSPVSLYQGFL